MNEDYMDKLVRDIQRYLKEEEREDQESRRPPVEEKSTARKRMPRSIPISLMTLLAASAVGSVTVAILLLGFAGIPVYNPINTIWLLAAGGCGVFFSMMLVSSWRRLVILRQIEENTRLILESKQRANALLEHYIRRMG